MIKRLCHQGTGKRLLSGAVYSFMWSRRVLVANYYHNMDRSTLQIVGSSVIIPMESSDGIIDAMMDYLVMDY